MKKTFNSKVFICGLIILSTLVFGCITKNEWYDFTSIEGGYKIEFPNKPTKDSLVANTEYGPLKFNAYKYEGTENDVNFEYSVTYVEYADSPIHSDSIELHDVFFRNSVDGCVENVHGELMFELIIEKNGYPGREIKVHLNEGKAVLKGRIFLVKNKLYMLVVLTKTSTDFNKSVTKFFDSFELL